MRAPIAPPPPIPTAAVEEGEAATEATSTLVALETPTEAGPSNKDVVVVLDEDSTPPSTSESRDVVMAPASELAQVTPTAGLCPAVEVSEPSPAVGVSGPPLTAEVAETSSARDALTAKEVGELVTCRYIDFPDIWVIDLEAPQLPEKMLEVAMKQMFNEPTIMETIASVSNALQEYERVGGFAPAVVADAADAALEAPTVEPTVDASAPLPAVESQETSLPQAAEAAEAPASVAEAGTVEAVVGVVGSPPPCPVAVGVGDVKTCVPDEPSTTAQEPVAPETMTGATSPEIQGSRRWGHPCQRARWAVKPRALSSPAPHGRPLSGSVSNPRKTRRSWRATP
jgi:hypothetical protein